MPIIVVYHFLVYARVLENRLLKISTADDGVLLVSPYRGRVPDNVAL